MYTFRRVWLPAVIAFITSAVSVKRPYLLSIPPIGGKWDILQLTGILFPVTVGTFLGVVVSITNDYTRLWLLKRAIVVVLLYFLGINLYVGIVVYQTWKASPIGRYFLPPYSNLYLQILWRFLQPYIFASGAALGAMLFLTMLFRLFKKEYFTKADIYLAVFTGLVLGLERFLLALFLMFIIAFIIALYYHWQGKKVGVKLATPLFISCWICLFWGNEIVHALTGI